MGYEHKTMKEIMRRITNNEVYLPAIQRKLVWNYAQIEKLFDSIMLGYPIGTFLFWDVKKSEANDYTFYKFIQEFHERDKCFNELAPKPEMRDSIIGILDGQQRLSSMYIALQGSYSYKKPKARRNSPDAYPKRLFYLNLLKRDLSEDNGITYEFKFLTEKEAALIDTTHFWFPVKKSLEWKEANDCISYAKSEGYLSNNLFIANSILLWQRVTQDEIINYFEVKEKKLDDILDIFIRVNSGGTILSKSDLLFSTIVANWEAAREEIESLIKNINDRGDKFNFDNDFIMRLCLVLTDLPILFKVDNFKKANVEKIKGSWPLIEKSLKATVDLLVEYGFSGENLTSNNSIIPITYHIFKEGNLTPSDKKNIRGYLIASLLKQIYGGKNDQVLDNIRNKMRKEEGDKLFVLQDKSFDISKLIDIKLPDAKTMILREDDIDNLFENYKKGPYTFMVLSLLYPHLKLAQIKFHQDHLHPESFFKNKNLKATRVETDKWEQWQDDKDKLANLQLLQSEENLFKNDKSLLEFLESIPPNQLSDYKKTNFIPDPDCDIYPDTFYNFSNFETFIKKRKELMKKEIVEKLQEVGVYKVLTSSSIV